jgi:hypothetical protein
MSGYETLRFRNVMPKGQVLRQLLAEADEFACANVRDAGQPFAASLHVYDASTGELTPIGGIQPGTDALSPDVIAALKQKLGEMAVAHTKRILHREPAHVLEQQASPDAAIVIVSTGECGPADHARQEILARTLWRERLLENGKFIVGYGAPWAESKGIGPDFEAIFDDMQERIGQGAIKLHSEPSPPMGSALSAVFSGATKPVAAVLLADGTVIAGHEDKNNGIGVTAESDAIHKAWQHMADSGASNPHDLSSAKLYTPTFIPGPIAYAEAEESGIADWVVTGPLPNQRKLMTQEAPDISNHLLFDLVAARPYNQPGSAVTVMPLTPFAGKALALWQQKHQSAPAPLTPT